MYVCGDLNSCCGNQDDFITGVNVIKQRNIVEYKTNAYGDHLIQSLIDRNMCILNGRNYICNDYTSVSSK